jgi:hypothetical protein
MNLIEVKYKEAHEAILAASEIGEEITKERGLKQDFKNEVDRLIEEKIAIRESHAKSLKEDKKSHLVTLEAVEQRLFDAQADHKAELMAERLQKANDIEAINR